MSTGTTHSIEINCPTRRATPIAYIYPNFHLVSFPVNYDLKALKNQRWPQLPRYGLNSDSTQFIDLNSGQLYITKVGNHYEGNAGDGGEVFLCNIKTKYWVSIVYNSVGTWMEEAVWVSDSKCGDIKE